MSTHIDMSTVFQLKIDKSEAQFNDNRDFVLALSMWAGYSVSEGIIFPQLNW